MVCLLIDAIDQSEVIWDSSSISVEEVKACFPDSSGIILIHSLTRRAIRATNGVLQLEDGQSYIVPTARSTIKRKEESSSMIHKDLSKRMQSLQLEIERLHLQVKNIHRASTKGIKAGRTGSLDGEATNDRAAMEHSSNLFAKPLMIFDHSYSRSNKENRENFGSPNSSISKESPVGQPIRNYLLDDIPRMQYFEDSDSSWGDEKQTTELSNSLLPEDSASFNEGFSFASKQYLERHGLLLRTS